MTCPRCGAELPANAARCENCGAKLTPGKRCPHCHALVPANAVICPHCDELLENFSASQPAPRAPGPKSPTDWIKELPSPAARPKKTFKWWQLVAGILLFALGVTVGSLATELNDSKSPEESSAASSEPQSQLASLDGLWKQVNAKDGEPYLAAGISGSVIEVMRVDPETGGQTLYWAGTADVPEDLGAEFSWESENDTAKTGSVETASQDEAKTFTYSGGQLQFTATLDGVSSVAKLKKISDTPPEMAPAQEGSPAPAGDSEGSIAVPAGSGVLGDYEVSILSARRVSGRDGTPAVIVAYEFTNHSEESLSFIEAIRHQAFQDGVELNPASAVDDSDFRTDEQGKLVRSGGSIQVEAAYLLAHDTADVDVKLTEQMADSGGLVETSFNLEDLERAREQRVSSQKAEKGKPKGPSLFLYVAIRAVPSTGRRNGQGRRARFRTLPH